MGEEEGSEEGWKRERGGGPSVFIPSFIPSFFLPSSL
jgi:hypothetical protein